MSADSKTSILDTVRNHLGNHKPVGFTLAVSDDVQQDGDWWYVVVLPNPPDVRAYDYNQLMARVEDEIEDQEHIKVLLVPAMPD